MGCVTFRLVWLPVGGEQFVIWVVSLLCWCGCRLVGGSLSFRLGGALSTSVSLCLFAAVSVDFGVSVAGILVDL